MDIQTHDLKTIEAAYDCLIETKQGQTTGNVNSVIVTCKDEATLQFYFEENDKVTVKILKSKLAPVTTVDLLNDMNGLLQRSVHSTVISQIRSSLKLLKDTTYKQSRVAGSDGGSNFISTTHGLCANNDDKETKLNQKQKNITLAPNFSVPLKSSPTKNCAKKKTSPNNNHKSSKLPPMKTAQDVINRIKWDETLDSTLFTVGYEDRFDGIQEREFSEFDWDSNLADLGPDVFAIPQHRIQYFKFKNGIVWDKKNRLDRIFGSTGSRKAIFDNINEEVEINEGAPDLNVEEEEEVMNVDEVMINEAADKPSFQEVVEDVADTSHEQSNKKRKTRPNYFIGVRIDRDDIVQSVDVYMNQLMNAIRSDHERDITKNSFSPLKKLHITLCVCHLESEEDIVKVKEIMEQTASRTPPFQVAFSGISDFNRVVFFARPNSRDICPVQKNLIDALKEQDVDLSGTHPKFRPHLTIFKLPYKRSDLLNKMSKFIGGKKSKKWKFGNGPQRISTIHLCKIGSTGVDGFYETVASFPLQSCHTEDGAIETDFSEPRRKKQRRHNTEPRPQSASERTSATSESRQRGMDVRLGISLSAVLRHNKYGFTVDSGGYIDINAILKHQRFSRVTREDIYRVVENNDKKRFTIDIDENGAERIKANQGHSVEVEDLTLTKVDDPSKYPVVIHGTFRDAWNSISKSGLHRRKRIHIHMTTAEPSDNFPVISGMRRTCNVFVYIDIGMAMRDGIKFFVSSNGVILSGGDKNGFLKPKYFQKVIGLQNKKRCVLLENLHSSKFTNLLEDEGSNDILEDIIRDMVNKVVLEESVDDVDAPSSSPELIESSSNVGEEFEDDNDTM